MANGPDQKKVEKLKKLREKVDWKMKKERCDLLDRLCPLIKNWRAPYPNLTSIFRPDEIDRLLSDAVNHWPVDYVNQYGNEALRIVRFVAETGYKDEPKLDKRSGRPRLRRTTPIHLAARRRMTAPIARDDPTILELFRIYDRYDLNYVDETGLTHFHAACLSYCSDTVERFLELGRVDPNGRWRRTGDSPLHLACTIWQCWDSIHAGVVRVLLENGANPNAVDAEGRTPLHILAKVSGPCARHQMHDAVDMIFDLGERKYRPVRINARDKAGNTPLHWAVSHDQDRLARLLLRRGADPNLANDEGLTFLHVTCRKYNDGQDSLRLFLELNDEAASQRHLLQIDAPDKKGQTPLQWAVDNILPDMVDTLLDRGADLSNFVLPDFGKELGPRPAESSYRFKLRLASGVFTVVERLQNRGYRLDRNEATKIMRFFARNGLFDQSPANRGPRQKRKKPAAKSWYDDERFTSRAKKMMVAKPNVTLYDLVQLRPEEAAKRVTFQQYFEFACSKRFHRLLKAHKEACVRHVCEKIARGFFRTWGLDPFMEVINYTLPIECCERIMEGLKNEDLCNVCLAVATQNDQDSEAKVDQTECDKRRSKRARIAPQILQIEW
ncbi:hypothetical protein TKK_0005128 [Trichogramma kaykai]|uniref:Uncharacterized protein n=1 Tax=Trichogramma kaykai TaxID=54128 RepID=A0ABD2XKM0_9HYME